MNDIRPNDDTFDQAMRDRYRLATGSVSAATQSQLRQARQARHAAAIGDARKSRFSWPLLLGGATAAVFAVAFGLGLHKQALLAPDATQPTPVATAAAYEDPASALDQDPDFYAWLGSADAELVAME